MPHRTTLGGCFPHWVIPNQDSRFVIVMPLILMPASALLSGVYSPLDLPRWCKHKRHQLKRKIWRVRAKVCNHGNISPLPSPHSQIDRRIQGRDPHEVQYWNAKAIEAMFMRPARGGGLEGTRIVRRRLRLAQLKALVCSCVRLEHATVFIFLPQYHFVKHHPPCKIEEQATELRD